MDILIENLTKKYENKTVLSINKQSFISGKLYGIIGPNGAGKSTLLKIIAGIESKTNGIILYNGKTLNDKIIKNVTYMSQTPYLLRTSIFNNIAYPLKVRKYTKRDINIKVNEIINELGLSDLKEQLATSLSGGESQKVALARAIVYEPEVLLLDEPTSNINPDTIESIEKIIQKRNKKNNMTTIIVTHNMDQAQRLCNEVITINTRNFEK